MITTTLGYLGAAIGVAGMGVALAGDTASAIGLLVMGVALTLPAIGRDD